MENEQAILAQAIKANGPDGLMTVLRQLHNDIQNGAAEKNFFILYQLGSQRSLIQVDAAHEPYHFSYKDLLGRPMTKAVENTIAEFLWRYCGEQERYTKGLSSRESL